MRRRGCQSTRLFKSARCCERAIWASASRIVEERRPISSSARTNAMAWWISPALSSSSPRQRSRMTARFSEIAAPTIIAAARNARSCRLPRNPTIRVSPIRRRRDPVPLLAYDDPALARIAPPQQLPDAQPNDDAATAAAIGAMGQGLQDAARAYQPSPAPTSTFCYPVGRSFSRKLALRERRPKVGRPGASAISQPARARPSSTYLSKPWTKKPDIAAGSSSLASSKLEVDQGADPIVSRKAVRHEMIVKGAHQWELRRKVDPQRLSAAR
jgi:hypothetical protein